MEGGPSEEEGGPSNEEGGPSDEEGGPNEEAVGPTEGGPSVGVASLLWFWLPGGVGL